MGTQSEGEAGWGQGVRETLFAGFCWLQHGYTPHKFLSSYPPLKFVSERIILDGTPRQIVFELQKVDEDNLYKLVKLIEDHFQNELGFSVGKVHQLAGLKAVEFIQDVQRERKQQTAAPAGDQEAKKPAYQPKQDIIDLINKNKGSFRGWLANAQLEIDGIVIPTGKENPVIDYSQGQRIFYDAYEKDFLKHGRGLKSVQDSLKKKTSKKVKKRGSSGEVQGV